MHNSPEERRLAAASHIEGCSCSICRYEVPVEVEAHLLREMKSGNVTIVAGAGISTERGSVDGPNFYSQMVNRSGSTYGDAFPDVMQRLVEQPDGRIDLIQAIRDRLDYVEFFPKLRAEATEFHREIATLFCIKDIVTTNWDTYFERFCHATPFVHPQDAVLWEAADRRVLKIHGTIENYATIVASTDDYAAAATRLSHDLIGSRLKILLSTKTVVFAGYSIRDSDFQQIYRFVRDQLGPFGKRAYAITIDTSDEMARRLLELNIVPIYTDASHFFRTIKAELSDWNCWLPDQGYDLVDEVWSEARTAWSYLHDKVDPRKFPEIVIGLSYLDGLLHGLEMIREKRKTGQYSHSCVIREKVWGYEELKAEYRRKKKYHDVAYMEGFQNALIFRAAPPNGLEPSDTRPPLFFFFGAGDPIESAKEYVRILPQLRARHRASSDQVRRLISNHLDPNERIHFYHKCQI
jgi:hypothetical protein